mmetsp:Transcript_88825/g.287656  ORF Transcript_88825/g.287656 Transcript_88825/m.287656 type:complete len:322 (+) Transcript_88825:156-1121(+)
MRARSPGATSMSRRETSWATAAQKVRSSSVRRSLPSSLPLPTSKAQVVRLLVSRVRSVLPNLGTSGASARLMSSSNSGLRRHSVACTRTVSSAMRRGSSLGSKAITSFSTTRRVSDDAAASCSRAFSASHWLPGPAETPPGPRTPPSARSDSRPPAPPREPPTRPRATLSCACCRMPRTELASFLLPAATSGMAMAGGAAGAGGAALGVPPGRAGPGSAADSEADCSNAASCCAASAAEASSPAATVADSASAAALLAAESCTGAPFEASGASTPSCACFARRMSASLSKASGSSFCSVSAELASPGWFDTRCVAAVTSCV